MPEKVRDQRASATFWTTSPIFIGIRSLNRSQATRPFSVFFQRTNTYASAAITGIRMYHEPVTASETPTVILVIAGSSELSPFSCEISSKMPTKTGTTKATIATITTIATEKTIAGYIIADFTWRLSASSFSSWAATRSSACSSRPDPSPASTIER